MHSLGVGASIVWLLASILKVEWIHGYGDVFSLLPVSRNNDNSCFETSFELCAHAPCARAAFTAQYSQNSDCSDRAHRAVIKTGHRLVYSEDFPPLSREWGYQG